MGVTASGKVFGGVINDTANTYYSDPEWNAALGAGEKYEVELKASNVTGAGTATVSLETSSDNINWSVRNSGLINGGTITVGATLFGAEKGDTSVGGVYARFGVRMASATGAYFELFVTARSFV